MPAFVQIHSKRAQAWWTGYHTRMTVRTLFKWGASLAFGVVGIAAAVFGQGQSTAELKVGDPAPAFSLQGSDGNTYKLSDFRGKHAVVLAWFPKAFTGG